MYVGPWSPADMRAKGWHNGKHKILLLHINARWFCEASALDEVLVARGTVATILGGKAGRRGYPSKIEAMWVGLDFARHNQP